MRVLQMTAIETGTYDDPYTRGYTTHLSHEDNSIQLLKESTNNGQIVTPGGIAQVAASVLKQSAHPDAMCVIPNNWSERRLRIILELETNNTNITRNRQILTGYTDYSGYSDIVAGKISFDPNMRVYFNNNVMLRDSAVRNPAGGMAYNTTVADDSQLLRPDTLASMDGQIAARQNTFSLRPEDLMGAQAANMMVMQRGGGEVFDSRATLLQGVRKSHRDNGIASRYLAKSIQALGNAYLNTDVESEPSSAVFNQAFTAVQEQQMYADQFFMLLNNRTNYLQTGYVTWGELNVLLPEIDQQCTFIRPSSTAQMSENYQRGQLEHWYGSGIETVMASRILSSVPGVMVENMMTSVFFTATNRTIDGRFALEIGNNSVSSFTQGLDMTRFMSRFEVTVISEILATLTQNNLIDIDVDVWIDLNAESRIGVSVAGAPKIQFGSPVFCDALYSPVMTLNPHTLVGMGEDLNTLVSFINTPNPMFGVGGGNPTFMSH